MAIKYFCDICGKETSSEDNIHLMGRAKLKTFCKSCWEIVENKLLKLRTKNNNKYVTKENS